MKRVPRLCHAAPAAVVIALASPVLATEPASREAISARPPAPGERGLEARLLAPCCWQGTLDAHESEPAQALRMQIRSRLYAGETVEAIEEGLVEQYGDRIRARPRRDPLGVVAAVLMIVAGFAGLAVLRVVRRWRRAGAEPRALTPAAIPAEVDAYDARVDAELADME